MFATARRLVPLALVVVGVSLGAAAHANAASTWSLSNDGHGAGPLMSFGFGQPGDSFISGDWNGDGTDTPGLFRPAGNVWILSNSTTGGGPLITFAWGNPGDLPVIGDWDGDGTDTVGRFVRGPAPDTQPIFYLGTAFSSSGGQPPALPYRNPGELGFAGDWNNDNRDTIGVYRFVAGRPQFVESDANTTDSPGVIVPFGDPGDVPLIGDWNGDGIDTPGTFRGVAAAGRWGFATSNNPAGVMADGFGFGSATDTPVVGDWDGNGTDTPALVQPGVDYVPAPATDPGSGAAVPNGQNAARGARLSVGFKDRTPRSLRLKFASRPTITGRLVAESGTPIGGATVTVHARRRQFRAVAAQIDTVTTGADGSFSYRLPSGPARTITFDYTAFAGDARPAVTSAGLRTLGAASLTAKATPRAPRGGVLMRLAGALRHLPRANVQVTIQARQGRSWNTVATVKTRAGGRYSWPHRFTRAQRGRTFRLRAHVDSPVYPFTPGNSRPVSVRVR